MATVRPQYLQVSPGTIGHQKVSTDSDEIKGGQFTAAGISGTAFNAGSNKIINVASPTSGNDAVNKTYVDSMATGLQFKAPCRVATTAAITISAPGASIDGVTLSSSGGVDSLGDRVLVKNQATTYDNGIYIFKGAATPMVRASDAPASSTIALRPGSLVNVTEGTTNADSSWVITSDTAITIGDVSLGVMTWTLFTSVTSNLNAGSGLTKAASTISVVKGDGIEIVSNSAAVNVDPDGTSIVLTGSSPNKKVAIGALQSDAMHGNRGGGALHSNAVNAGAAGFMSGSDKANLDSLYASQTAKFFYAAPNGSAGSPSFRAIVASDIPTLNQATTAQSGSVANVLTMNNGGAGDASGTTYNGGAARTISYNTIGAAPLASPVFTGLVTIPGGDASNAGGLKFTASSALKTSPVVGDAGRVEWFNNALSIIDGSANRKMFAYLDSTLTYKVQFDNSGTGASSGAQYNNSAIVTISYNTLGAAAAGHTHSTLTFNNGGAGGASGTTYNGGSTATISYNTIGALGAAAAAASVANALTISNDGAGDVSGSTYNGSAAKKISYNSIGALAASAAAASVANALTFKNDGTGDAANSTFNGGTARNISYNSIGAVPTARTVAGTASQLYVNNGSTNDATAKDLTNNLTLSVVGVPSLFKINGVSTSANVTATALNDLTTGLIAQTPSGDTYHKHQYLYFFDNASLFGENVTVGDPITIDGTGKFMKAKASASDREGNVVGLAGRTLSNGAKAELVTFGLIDLTGALGSFGKGDPVYLGNAGGLSDYNTISAGSRVIQVGFVDATNNFLIVNILDMGAKPTA